MGYRMYSQYNIRTVERARELLLKEPIFLDTETTGLDNRAEIIEISIVDYQGKVLFDELVKPMRTIPIEATRVHGITNDDIKYWRDTEGVHHVPKRSLQEIIL